MVVRFVELIFHSNKTTDVWAFNKEKKKNLLQLYALHFNHFRLLIHFNLSSFLPFAWTLGKFFMAFYALKWSVCSAFYEVKLLEQWTHFENARKYMCICSELPLNHRKCEIFLQIYKHKYETPCKFAHDLLL